MSEPVAIYAALADCTDPVVTVETSDLLAADRVVIAVLRNKGIDPATVTGAAGLALLKDLAVAEATAGAARRSAVDKDSGQWAKMDAYQKQAIALSTRIDRESLGLAVTGSGAAGYGSIPLGRG
ncbi:hypothetical protein [uncultured Thiodictyon sp.]|uniref:hypothetical protein n=1 Tax=uncultured Thiodictyon sp. TaxID=1846217 RepID=UPI0025D115E8|nr:hypothetical protein [uncultured Thiodictyon sp.]